MSSTVQSMNNSTNKVQNVADLERMARVARYKEERRRQLDSQFAVKNENASMTNNPAMQNGRKRYISRKSSEAENKEAVTKPLTNGSVNLKNPVRTTRTSQLRTIANTLTNNSRTSCGGISSSSDTGKNSPLRNGKSTTTNSVSSSPRSISSLKSPTQQSSVERDKSSKRKSNLNRSLNSEEVPSNNYDSLTSIRTRRQFGSVSSSYNSMLTQPKPTLTDRRSRNQISPTISSSLRSKLKSPDDDQSSSTTLSDRENKSSSRTRNVSQKDAQIKRKTNSSLKTLNENVNPKRPSSSPTARKSLSLKVNETSRRMDSLKQSTAAALSRVSKLEAKELSKKDLTKTENVDRKILTQVPKASTSQDTSLPEIIVQDATVSEDRGIDAAPPEIVVECSDGRRGSILKQAALPVSILKRKISQDEGSSVVQAPVTFSPSVMDPPICSRRRQGILKKRRSLDESEVLRRRSCSPTIIEGTSTDFRPILKQRRSSLEEIRIGTSPEPQSILKRKPSRTELDTSTEERSLNSPEPQSILKRKSVSNSSDNFWDPPYVSIEAAVLLAAAGGAEIVDDNLPSILKKKCDSIPNLSSDDVPRPILKKKCSTDTDDYEDRPKKTILKTSRASSSVHDSDSETVPKGMLRNCKSSDSSSFESTVSSSSPSRKVSSDVRPILKQSSRDSSPRPRIDEVCVVSDTAVLETESLRRSLTGISPTYRSRSSGADYEGSYRRRSLQLQQEDPNIDLDDVNERNRTLSLNDMTDPEEGLPGSSLTVSTSSFGLSVAERILQMESISETKPQNGAIPRRRNSLRGSSEFERFENGLVNGINSVLQPPISRSNLESCQQPLSCYSQNGGETNSLLHPNQQDASVETFYCDFLSSQNSVLINSVINLENSSHVSLSKMESESSRTSPVEDLLEEKPRRNSVAARAAELNKQCEEQKKTKVNAGIERYKQRKANRSHNRFSTQPVTDSEIKQAAQQNQNTENDTDENDPSKLTLAERVKLFNKKALEEIASKSANLPPNPPPMRRRVTRNKTQPVTTDEWETVQRRNINLVASFGKAPDAKELVGLSIKETKEKIHQHAAKILTNEVKGILKSKSFVSPIVSSCNLERGSPSKSVLKKSSSDEKSDPEPSITSSKSTVLRSILKIDSDKSDSEITYSKKLDQMTFSCSSSSSEGESSGGREVNSIIRSESRVKQKHVECGDKGLLHKSKSHSKVDSIESADLLENEEKKSTIIPKPPITLIAKKQSNLLTNNNKNRVESSSSCSDDNTDQPPPFRRLCQVRRSRTTNDMPASPDDVTDHISSVVSIAERRAALQNSGNNDWKRRVVPVNKLAENELKNIISANNLINVESSKHEEKSSNEIISSSKLSDRVSKLETASHGWKKRVEPSDVEKFTVEGRMRNKGEDVANLTASGIMSLNGCKEKRSPKPIRLKTKETCEEELEKTITMGLKRSISAPNSDEASNIFGPTVSVPRPDDETFTSFYSSISNSHTETITESITTDDLNAITRNTQDQLLGKKRNIVIHRKHGHSRNPIKSLNARTDLRTEYTEIKTGIADRELMRVTVEKMSKSSNLAVAALAGLASKEDFTAVNLKKTSNAVTLSMLPHTDLMLIQVKGRRHVQARLVEPVTSSINHGDAYVLVTKTQVFNYIGAYSNVIEQSRASEIASANALSGNKQIITIKEDTLCSPKHLEDFWSYLGHEDKTTPPKIAEAGHPDEDEIFESKIIDTNMVYMLENDELLPYKSYWGCIPKIEMLDPAKILIFDFGTELYVWNGKNSSLDRRKLAVKLAKDLWQEGYDYTDCDICPINATQMLGARDKFTQPSKKSTSRPTWALLSKVNQNMEPVLFREKFLDWPDYSRVIKIKEQDPTEKTTTPIEDIDVTVMVKGNKVFPNLVLEGSQLGRGNQFYDSETNRVFEITTTDVKKWHVQELECLEVDSLEMNQFYSGDNFIIRWQYTVAVTGRELGGKPSRHSLAGRDRCAYFFWQGKHASLFDKGAAALFTVSLDHEHSPQIRISEGSETPAFLNLFHGGMIVHDGKRFTENDNNNTPKSWQLYLCRGDHKNEAFLTEVPCNMRQLRSRTSMVFVNESTASILVWHGAKSLPNSKEIAKFAAGKLSDYLGKKLLKVLSVGDVYEGQESAELLKVLGASSGRELYYSLMDKDVKYDETPRLFHFTSLHGVFEANEVFCPFGSEEANIVTPYPFLQTDLYSARQPTIFLFDDKETLWLWQGWWPENDSDSERDSPTDPTGSWVKRWQEERRSAMETTINYWKEKYPSQNSDDTECPAVLVWAGLEPLEFTNLFPSWSNRDDVAEINIRDGRKPGEMLSLSSELARLTCCTYPAPVLLQRPLPDGVDPTMLEKYLSPTHFTQMFPGLTKEEFYKLPQWKQTNLKKNSGLF